MLNLAGLLMFAEQPELVKPQFVLKAIRYPGNQIHATNYLDTEEFAGSLPKIFEDAMAFIMRNLHKIQVGRGVNTPGIPEISATVFEELLVNALVHRDYLVSAPVRLFIFDNRIEIISPGHLPNNLTTEKIRTGITNIRNPILVSYVAKGLLPYHGLGSGIKRALGEWQGIDFIDDREGSLFTAIVYRQPLDELALQKHATDKPIYTHTTSPKKENDGKALEKWQESTGKVAGKEENKAKMAGKILDVCRERPHITIPELAKLTGGSERTVQRNIQKLQADKLLKRVGGRKMGYWEVQKR